MAKAKKTTENPAPKKPSTRAKSGAAAAPAEALTPVFTIQLTEEQVRRLAYELYLKRNGNGGTPEEDWYRAEAELRGKSA